MESVDFTWSGGYVTPVKRISPNLRLRVRSSVESRFPKPQPPMIHIEHGVDGPIDEPNITDPDYQLAVQKWEQDLESEVDRQFTNLVILSALEIDLEVAKLALADLDSITNEVGLDIAEPELNIEGKPYKPEAMLKLRFIKEVCNASYSDWNRFIRVLYRDVVEERDVALATETFPR